MQQSNGLLQVAGEMVSIVLLALTGRFIGFAQSTLEAGTPLGVDARWPISAISPSHVGSTSHCC
jgi:hypothetical protein